MYEIIFHFLYFLVHFVTKPPTSSLILSGEEVEEVGDEEEELSAFIVSISHSQRGVGM